MYVVFDCVKCKYHVQPRTVNVRVAGMDSCSSINTSNPQVDVKIDIDSYHRCAIYGCEKTSKVFDRIRCKKNRLYKITPRH